METGKDHQSTNDSSDGTRLGGERGYGSLTISISDNGISNNSSERRGGRGAGLGEWREYNSGCGVGATKDLEKSYDSGVDLLGDGVQA